jgi:hypothetical protein
MPEPVAFQEIGSDQLEGINRMAKDSADRNGDKKPPESSRQPPERSSRRPIKSIEERLRGDILRVREQLHRSGALGIQELLRPSSAFQLHNELHQKLFGLDKHWRHLGVPSIQESLRDSPTFEFQEQPRHGLLEIQEQVRQFGAFGIQEALRDSPIFQMREQLERDLLGFQEQFESYSLHSIQNVLRNVSAESLLFGISRIQDPFNRLRELAEFLNQEELGDGILQIGPEGEASLAGETAPAAEIELAFQELFDQLQDYLADVQAWLLRLQKPVRALIGWFISNLFIPYLVGLYFQQQGSLELREMQRRLELEGVKTRQEVIAAIKKKASGPIAGDESYRVVTGVGVRIRARPSRNALVKGLLPRGTVVRFVEKRGPWTAVEYVDPDNSFIQSGWVFNKYLRRMEYGSQ